MSALPPISDINLFRYCESIVDLDAQIPDGALDLRVTEQKLHRPQVGTRPVKAAETVIDIASLV